MNLARYALLGALPFALACPPPPTDDGGATDAGAVEDAGPGDNDAGGPPPPPDAGPEGPAFEHTDNGDGTTTTQVHSTSSTVFFLDLETRAEVEVTDPTMSTAWDLGFTRYHVLSNGGVSGPGGVEVAPLEPGTFDALIEAPEGGYLTDAEDADLDGNPDYVISTQAPWWQYDVDTHVISVTGQVYVVKSVEARYYKLELLDYYLDGESGHPLFRWAEIAPPGGYPDAGPSDAGPTDAGPTDANG